jgi:type I restriction enzyme S subunit
MIAKNESQRIPVLPEKNLPPNWTLATISDMVAHDGIFIDGDWVESKDQDQNGDMRLIQLADIGDGVYRNRSNRYLTYAKAVELGCTFLKPNDVLIARMPDPLGRACIFPGDTKKSVTAVDVCIVRTGTQGPDHRWLIYTINSPSSRSAIEILQSGTTRKRISRKNLAKLEFPLPPLLEQRRIVANIEELFTKLDAGAEALKKVKLKLKRYRQAVLKHAFEGRLTEEWRKINMSKIEPAFVLLERIKKERKKKLGKKYKELLPADTSELPGLPEGWVWTSLGDIADFVMGQAPPGEECNTCSRGAVFVKAGEFGPLYPIVREWTTRPLKLARQGDVLICVVGATAGKLNLSINCAIGRSVAAIRPLCEISPHFVFYQLQPKVLTLRGGSVGSAQGVISKAVLHNIEFLLPPLPEQHKIVEEIERSFSVADQVEKIVEQNLKQAERLRQSILKRAFEGKLVSQDPSDEPAEKLLERIKAEKAKHETERKNKRTIRYKRSRRKRR